MIFTDSITNVIVCGRRLQCSCNCVEYFSSSDCVQISLIIGPIKVIQSFVVVVLWLSSFFLFSCHGWFCGDIGLGPYRSGFCEDTTNPFLMLVSIYIVCCMGLARKVP